MFETGFGFCFFIILTGGETVFVTRRFTIIGLRFIGLAFVVGRLAIFLNGFTVLTVRFGLTFTVFRTGLPTEVRFVAFTLEVVRLVVARVRDVDFLDVDFLPLDLRPLLERPRDPPRRAIIFYAPLKVSKLKRPLK